MPRVLLAVSGTLQEGFELRGNLDSPGAPAVHVGGGLIRGVKAFLDVKEEGSREHRAPPAAATVNPACVLTSDPADANVYALYLVDEAALVRSLLGEPRYLAMAPDAVVLDLDAPETAPAVRALAAAACPALSPSSSPPSSVSVLAVVAAVRAPTFIPMPPCAPGSSAVTSFPEGLRAFADAEGGGDISAALRHAEVRLSRDLA